MTLEERVAALESELARLRAMVESFSIAQVEGDVQIHLSDTGPVAFNVDVVEGDYSVVLSGKGDTAIQMFSDSVEGEMLCTVTAECQNVMVTQNADSVGGDASILINAPIANFTANTNQDSMIKKAGGEESEE